MKRKIKTLLARATTHKKEIPIDYIRHNDLKCYIDEGYGGKHISFFPPYSFFLEYHHGNKNKAFNKYIEWYKAQFHKYHDTQKDLGGMKNGSLLRLIEKKHRENGIHLDSHLNDLDKDIYELSIKERVQQRFHLLETIKTEGFKEHYDPIFGNCNDGYIYLKGGHHRCAILYLLGYEYIPVHLSKGAKLYHEK